jgi:hypothetical protein
MTLKASRSSMTFWSKPHRPYFWRFSKRNLEAALVGGLFSSPCHLISMPPPELRAPRGPGYHGTTSGGLPVRLTCRFIRERPDMSEHIEAHLRGDT